MDYLTRFHNLARLHFSFGRIAETIDGAIHLKSENEHLPAGTPLPNHLLPTYRLVQSALVLTVVQYARPFSNNKNSEGSNFSFPSKATKSLKSKHQKIIDLRNKAIAHTDGGFQKKLEGIEIRIENSGPNANTIGYRWEENYLSLPEIDLPEYRALVGYVHDKVIREKMLGVASEMGLEPGF
mgnify:CR=1 FL=1